VNTACFAWRLQNSGTSDPGLLSVWAAVCMGGAVFWDTSAAASVVWCGRRNTF